MNKTYFFQDKPTRRIGTIIASSLSVARKAVIEDFGFESPVRIKSEFKAGKIYARKGRHFVQASINPNWPKFGVFGANPSAWHDTLQKALNVLELICDSDPYEHDSIHGKNANK